VILLMDSFRDFTVYTVTYYFLYLYSSTLGEQLNDQCPNVALCSLYGH